ncbi:MAG: MBL fold metallo-hydrolase [Desulfuromonadales bacterium]|nr:MBL fold metallo-hydrolase [Desulfuromonadales bacterium]
MAYVFLSCLLITTLVGIGFAAMPAGDTGRAAMINEPEKSSMTDMKNLNITVIYDNNPYRQGLATGWGFSCLLRGIGKTILFDTGGDGEVLLANMEKLDIHPNEIDIVVLSHVHGDHIGGVERLLAVNPAITVYLPRSFPAQVKDNLHSAGIKTREVHDFTMICENVYSTGELGTGIKEQSLLVQTGQGIIVITGCSHPGIVEILIAAKKLLHADKVLLAMGGFHLSGNNPAELKEIAAAFKRLGIIYVGPCHCSGDLARQIFAEAYREYFIQVGVGKEISCGELARTDERKPGL